MVIIELKYKKPLAMVEGYLEGHQKFLQKYYGQGIFLLSGPKHPCTGNVIVATGDFEMARNVIKEDPFYQAEVAEYNIIEFDASKSTNVD